MYPPPFHFHTPHAPPPCQSWFTKASKVAFSPARATTAHHRRHDMPAGRWRPVLSGPPSSASSVLNGRREQGGGCVGEEKRACGLTKSARDNLAQTLRPWDRVVSNDASRACASLRTSRATRVSSAFDPASNGERVPL